MKRLVIIFLVLFILGINIVYATEVESIIEEKLEEQEEVSVIVMLKDDVVDYAEGKMSVSENSKEFLKEKLEKKKMMIKEKQEKVLSKLNLDVLSVEAMNVSNVSEVVDFKLRRKYSTVNGFYGSITKEGLEKLKNDEDVDKIYFDEIYQITLNVSVPKIGADKVWIKKYSNMNITGRYETICVLDTGIDTDHSAFENRILDEYCYGTDNRCPDDTSEDDSAEDDHGHGTHVSGIAAGNHTTYRGVAPEAGIVAIKVCNSDGGCPAADVVSGIDWCVANASKYNISVITISIGSNTAQNTYCNDNAAAESINTAVGQGIIVTIAAGNCVGISCTSGIGAPACVQNATPVGGSNSDDTIGYQRGNILSLLAPLSATAPYIGGGTTTKSGTSMAAPHVAGAAALLRQFAREDNQSDLSPDQIETILNQTGVNVFDSGGTGLNFSRVDVYSAVSSQDTRPPNITIVRPANTTYTDNITQLINISYSEPITTWIMNWNGTNMTFTPPMTFTFNESQINLTIYGNDSGNNWDWENVTFRIAVPPVITIIRPQNTTYTTTTTLWINLSADETITTWIINWNGTNQTWVNGTNLDNVNKTFTFDNGTNINLTVYGNDSFNNWNWNNVTFMIDTSLPTIEVLRPENISYNNATQWINLTADENITGWIYSLDNGVTNVTFANSTNPELTNRTFTFSEGQVVLQIYGNDTDNNWDWKNVSFRIDLTAPTITIITPHNMSYNNITQWINVTSNEDMSTWIINWNGTNQTLANLTNPSLINRTFTFNDSFNHNLTIYANDTAGNWDWENITFRIDTTVPTFWNNATSGTYKRFSNFTANVTIRDDLVLNFVWFEGNQSVERTSNLENSSYIKISGAEYNFSEGFNISIEQGSNFAYSGSSIIYRFCGNDSTNNVNCTSYNWITITNTAPVIHYVNTTAVNETKNINITINATDVDNPDNLSYWVNNTRFSQTLTDNFGFTVLKFFSWATNMSDAGVYSVFINVSDGELIVNTTINITVLEAEDLDGDGNPDFNDTDDDNDGINNTDDKLKGNLTHLTNTGFTNLSLKINGSFNLNQIFNTTLVVNFTDGDTPLLEFEWNFSRNLALNEVVINKTNVSGFSALLIRGINLSSQNKTKTVYITHLTGNRICIVDRENITITGISSSCDNSTTEEKSLTCDGSLNGQYRCADMGNNIYKIEGLNHSVLREYTYTSPPDGGSSSPNGGGGSSGGGGVIAITYIVSDEQLAVGYTKSLAMNDSFKFNIKNETHYTKLTKLSNTTSTIEVTSKKQQATLLTNKEEKFELTEDNYYDLVVKLNNIDIGNKTANLTLRSIAEKMPTAAEGEAEAKAEAEEEAAVETAEAEETPEKEKLSYLGWVIGGAIIAGVIIAIIALITKKKK